MKGVYVLDFDMLCALGVGREEVLAALHAGVRGGRLLQNFPAQGLPNQAGAEVSANLESLLSAEPPAWRAAMRYDRKLELVIAAKNIVRARWSRWLDALPIESAQIWLGLGLDICPVDQMSREKVSPSYLDWARHFNSPPTIPNQLTNPIDIATQNFRQTWPALRAGRNVLTACASSAQALGLALRSLRRGECEVALAGGGDSLLNLLGYVAFLKMGVIPQSLDAPATQCRPLDVDRQGVLLGEGASLFLLASEDFVRRHRLTPRLALRGYGSSLDAFKITAPDPEGKGMKNAMVRALRDASLSPQDIGYINLHGTGTKANDPAEIKATREVFPAGVRVSSTKDRHGHLIAGAGALELAITCLALENDFLPGNLNLEKPIDTLGLEFVRGATVPANTRYALSSSFAFGGINASLVIERIPHGSRP